MATRTSYTAAAYSLRGMGLIITGSLACVPHAAGKRTLVEA